METNKFYPGLNRLLIKELPVPKKQDELLVSAESPFNYGEIISVGAIKDKKELEEFFNKGDRVYFLKNSGLLIDLPEGSYKLLNAQEVLVGERQ